MTALRSGLLLAAASLVTVVSTDAFAVKGLDRTLEIRRPSVAARAGLPGHAEVKLGNAARTFENALVSDRTVELASRSVVSRDSAFFRVPERDLTNFRTRTFMDGTTYVEYVQQYRGLEVMDSRVSMIFRDGELVLSTRIAFDGLNVDVTPAISAAAAESVARTSLANEAATIVATEAAPELVVYPQESGSSVVGRLAWRLVVKTTAPYGRFRTVVAADGSNEILNRKNLIAFDAAQILLEVEPRTFGDTPLAVAAKGIDLGAIEADMDGIFEATAGNVNVSVRGPWFTVNNQAATERTKAFTIAGGAFASYTWDSSESALEEVDTFYHSNIVRERQLGLTPDLGFLGTNFPVNVNLNDVCNAFFDGSSINFFPTGGGCNSTGRISDVVYHEYGHAIHFELTNGGMDSQIQEGVSDYFAHTITEDPNLGPYFFTGEVNGIRNATEVRTYPSGVQGANAAVHQSGRIWTNTWWNLRNTFRVKHGIEMGVKYADLLHSNTLRGNPTYPTAYALALAADDDDANLDNGTPNSCEITAEFQAHGLVQTARQVRGFLELTHDEPAPAGFYQVEDAPVNVSVDIASKSPASCGSLDAATVTLHFKVDGGAVQTVSMTGSGTSFSAAIPGQAVGAVVEYWFSAKETAVGAEFTAPQMAPLNLYRYNVGALNTVFRDDFETDGGWTHGGTLASHDDWERGAPGGVGFWDPTEAFSGNAVFGNDLGLRNGNGLVEAGASNWAESPSIDCGECVGARLQFRRWFSGQAGASGDVARVLVNGTEVWTSADYTGIFVDRHWELVDLPIPEVDGVADVKIRFEHTANGTLELGGMAIDDVELVATEGGVPPGTDPPRPGDSINGNLNGGCTCSLSGTSTVAPNGTLALSMLAGLAMVVRMRRRR